MAAMALNDKRESLQIRSLLRRDGTLELSLVKDVVPLPAAEEIVVRIDAAPINPSDLGLLLAFADWSHPTVTRNAEGPVVACSVSAGALRSMAARVDHAMPVGNEGAGLVIEAGSSPAAQGLLGKTVAVLGGAMYSQSVRPGQPMPGVGARHHGGGGRIRFRQSADGARHDRHDDAKDTRDWCTPPPPPIWVRC